MSFSVYFRAELKDANGVWIDLNNVGLTYNLSGMFNEILGYSLRRWNGRKAEDVVEAAIFGLDTLNYDPTKYRRYEAVNGWGTVETMREFLSEIIDLCREWPFATIEVN